MQTVSFTLFNAFNQFWAVCEYRDRKAISKTAATYFYLCNIWNTTGRNSSFRRLGTIACAERVISKPTFERHRKVLQENGLIEFTSAVRGDTNITYTILDVKNQKPTAINYQKTAKVYLMEYTPEVTEEVKKETTTEQEKEKIFTTPVTTPVTSVFTSNDTYKQSKSIEEEKEFFVVVNGQIKKIFFLDTLFTNDPGIKACWQRSGMPAAKISLALETWMIQNHGKAYPEMEMAKKHFLFWLPYYQTQNKKFYETKRTYTLRKSTFHGQTTDLDYAAGL